MHANFISTKGRNKRLHNCVRSQLVADPNYIICNDGVGMWNNELRLAIGFPTVLQLTNTYQVSQQKLYLKFCHSIIHSRPHKSFVRFFPVD